jgi:hypothetical protein
MKAIAALLVAASLMLAGFPSHASVTMALAPSIQNSAAGQSLVFYGTLANTSTTDEVFLNTVQLVMSGSDPAAAVTGSNTFYANVPGILEPGESYTGELFSVALIGSAPAIDYGGSVTLQGGTDIFAASNLGSEPFTLLSPAVTILASGTSASELGPVSCTLTVTRTGGTGIDLPLVFTIGGTAVDGSDYLPISASAVIASGSSSVTITITPIPDDIAEGDRTAIVSLAPSSLYNFGTPITATVVILDKPVDDWRFQNFGPLANTPQAADTAAWSGSGIVNLIAYALNIDPSNPDRALLPSTALLSNYLTLTYLPNPAATDVTYSVEASTNLVFWSAASVVPTTSPASAPPGSVTERYVDPVTPAGHVFMRLRVTRTDD